MRLPHPPFPRYIIFSREIANVYAKELRRCLGRS
ncbi:hypothetical protein H206_06122 [Candidatus Electrothrix aarhusensis]|uniref:Uncharacterized protein n=1 Tax=Candidatus Electrothrix aarhusensis TaxID=1859131 RepID=A0A3S3R169_9BACT|nr:hypothetical protein H206_06122 [Candidatus Electrothrix aarhusensis]